MVNMDHPAGDYEGSFAGIIQLQGLQLLLCGAVEDFQDVWLYIISDSAGEWFEFDIAVLKEVVLSLDDERGIVKSAP